MGRTLPIKITEIKFEECGAVCTPTVLALPYDLGQIEGSNVGTGNWSMWGSTQEPEIKLNCNPLYVCFYKTAFFGGTNKMNIFGGAPAKLEVKQLIETLTGASSAICGEKLEWEGDYKFTKPENGMPKMWPME
jgi:hypothetical protein